MRIKISGIIIENADPNITDYKHEVYSMILSNINTEQAKYIHTKKRFKRLFTFSDVYINDNKLHVYIAGEDNLIKDFINYVLFNKMVRIGKKVINITNIEPLDNVLKDKDEYVFKTNFIINQKENDKVMLSTDLDYVKRRITEIAQDKYKLIYGIDNNNNLEVNILNIKKVYNKYKNHYLNSYKIIFKIKGDKKLIETIYNVGIGENTASGHGFMWEV